LTDQQHQAPPAVVVTLVLLQVLGEVGDPLGEHRDLDLGGSGVALVGRVLGDDLLLVLCRDRHVSLSVSLRGALPRVPGSTSGGRELLGVRGRPDGNPDILAVRPSRAPIGTDAGPAPRMLRAVCETVTCRTGSDGMM